MKKIMICALFSLAAHTTIIENIPLQWLKNTTFYIDDHGSSMLLGQLLIRLENKKMDFGQFIAELLQLLNTQKKENLQLKSRIAALEHMLLPPDQLQNKH
ncbi:MAG: hypothetical protein WD055_02805 [Candidatus Dependentiae bacterium]